MNTLCAAFTRKDPKIVKIQSSYQYLFALLGSASVKALHKMLMKLTPDGRMCYVSGPDNKGTILAPKFFSCLSVKPEVHM
jgi:hypothetical protein